MNTSELVPTEQATPDKQVTPPTSPAAPAPKPNVAAGVNASSGVLIPPPKGVARGTTRSLDAGYFHGMLYGATDSRKTSTAAKFSGPENTLFILTRGKEQLMPVRDEGFVFVQVSDGAGLAWALQYPEAAAKWAAEGTDLSPEEKKRLLAWSTQPERTLVIDDTTEGAAQLVDDNRTNDKGDEVKDGRKIYGNTNIAFRDLLNSLKRKQMHTIFIALSKVSSNNAENAETISPALPTGISDLLTAELEFVFYMQPKNWKMLTKRSFLNYEKVNDKGKKETFKRDIFAKQKLPLSLALQQPPVVAMEEVMDLRSLWERVKKAKGAK